MVRPWAHQCLPRIRMIHVISRPSSDLHLCLAGNRGFMLSSIEGFPEPALSENCRIVKRLDANLLEPEEGVRGMNPSRMAVLIAAVFAVIGIILWSAGTAWTLPFFTPKEEEDCGSCHFDPNGAGPRNKFGFDYASSRNDPTEDPSWPELDLTNRVAKVLYFGTDTNGLYFFTQSEDEFGAESSTFFQMQSALYFTLRPIKNMFITYNLDWNEFSGSTTRDVYGFIQDNNENFYFKLGRIRGIYGLRQFDHTSGVRAGFLNSASGGTGGFLPYDPRRADTGIELGIRPGNFRFAAQLTNGGSAFENKAQAVSGLAVYNFPTLQLGIMGYDRWLSSNGTHASRLGGYGLWMIPGTNNLFLLGEIGLGTDDDGMGEKQNLRASYVEAIYQLNRAVRFRAKYDYSDLHESDPGNASERFAIESDITPIPFSDLKVGFRRIVVEKRPNQNELFGMWYFYY